MSVARPRVLMVLPQLPQDPTSGAARAMTSICELLAESGFEVRALGTSVTESGSREDPKAFLEGMGIAVERRGKPGLELVYEHKGVAFRSLLVDRSRSLSDWEQSQGRAFNLTFSEELARFHPDAMFTYGMFPGDIRRQKEAAQAGARVVFGLRNEAYYGFRQWDHLAAVLVPSEYLARRYREECGLESSVVFSPLDEEDVIAAEREPIFMTMVNPSRDKGVDFFAKLAEEMSAQRPDLPFLVIESRGNAGTLVESGLRAGFDLRRHENIMISGAVPMPKDIYTPTRVLLVPSLKEAGGRVVGEALMNGIPPVVSDCGGLPEMCQGAGRVLPLPQGSSSAACVEKWMEAIIPLMDDEALYASESQKATEAAGAHSKDVLRSKYAEFFWRVLKG